MVKILKVWIRVSTTVGRKLASKRIGLARLDWSLLDLSSSTNVWFCMAERPNEGCKQPKDIASWFKVL